MKIAYFINRHPDLSHTFVRREIRAIETLGTTVFRYALEPGNDLVNLEDKDEEGRTRYIFRAGAREFVRCNAVMLLTRPLGICRAVRQAVKIGWRSDRGIVRHLLYVAEAAVLACWCRGDSIQHVHAHFGTNSAAVALLAWRISGIPYSFTVHGPEEFDKAPLIGLAEKIRHCAFVVAISSYGRSQLYRSVELESWKKVQVVHCGLDPAVFSTATTPASLGRRLVCVGRLCEQKGHLLLVEAAQRLSTRGVHFELVLVGDGEMRRDTELLINRYQLQDKVRITGWLDDLQVWREISDARALVLPSFAEGLPVVIMEAMALRRPIISTFVAGIPELVRSGEHGWLVPAGDIEALVEAMQACLDATTDTLARMGELAQKRAFLRHNINVESVKLARLFEAAIAQNARRLGTQPPGRPAPHGPITLKSSKN